MNRRTKFRLAWRETRMIVRGLTSTRHPMLAHIIPMRRCNLACTYCNEYDNFSEPVPAEEIFRRIDKLASHLRDQPHLPVDPTSPIVGESTFRDRNQLDAYVELPYAQCRVKGCT